ncbi:hypothetical protein [Robbsia sp. KACC 23696]|uniref:hypothetical protein n=1 Tax=Robbsia sp. KACC 23696 TaxID=3149231 RepID=UPI00325C310A
MDHEKFSPRQCHSDRQRALSPLDIADADIDLDAHTLLDASSTSRGPRLAGNVSRLPLPGTRSLDYRTLIGDHGRDTLLQPTRSRGMSQGSDDASDFDTDKKKLERITGMIQALPEGVLEDAQEWAPENAIAKATSILRQQLFEVLRTVPEGGDDPAGQKAQKEHGKRIEKIQRKIDNVDDELSATTLLNAAPTGYFFSIIEAFYRKTGEHAFSVHTQPKNETREAFDSFKRAAYAALPDDAKQGFSKHLTRFNPDGKARAVESIDSAEIPADFAPDTVLAYRFSIKDVDQQRLANVDRGITRSSKLHFGQKAIVVVDRPGKRGREAWELSERGISEPGMTYTVELSVADGLDERALFGSESVASGPVTIGLEAIRPSRFGLTFCSDGLHRSNDAEIRLMQTLHSRFRGINFAELKAMYADRQHVEFQLDIVSSKEPCNSCAFAMSVFAETLSAELRDAIGMPAKLHLDYVVTASKKPT